MKIDGSIMIPVNCILEQNLPTTIVGNQWYITVKKANDTVGKLWVPNSNGIPVCLGDTPVTDSKLASLENQINVLNDKSLLNQDLNTKDIDKKTQENYIVGISEDGHGIIPFPEWNSIVQFSCSHFLSQLGFKINGTEARLAIRSTYAFDDSDWQIWTELATVEVKKVELLNGWQTQDGSTTATICKIGNHISFVHTLKNDNVVSVAPIFVSPYTFDSSEIVKYGTISFSADVVSAIACLPDGTVRYEGSNTGSRQYVGVNLQYDIK